MTADFDEQKEREAFNAWCISNAARPEQCKREWFGWSARARHQPSAPAWIAVSERLPEKMVHVLVFCPENPDRGAIPIFHDFLDESGLFWGAYTPVTHWQPLPSPPAEQ